MMTILICSKIINKYYYNNMEKSIVFNKLKTMNYYEI